HAAYRGDRHRELGFADAHEHRLGHRQRLRQAQGEAGALAAAGGDVERTAELADLAGDHVHADAATRQSADLVGRGEARLEDQHVQVAIAEHGARAYQPAVLAAAADRVTIQTRTVVADLQHHFGTFAAYLDA